MIYIKKKGLLIVILIIISVFTIFNLSHRAVLTSTNPSIKVPIIMYHHVLKDKSRLGKYIISPEEFENDIIYLKNEGYTPIFMEDLIAYVYDDKELPEKPIILTFDDGHYSNYTYILPILEKYNCKAVISIVGEYVDKSTKEGNLNPSYSYVTWDLLKEIINSPYLEIQNHTYYMHEIGERKGCTIKKGESYEKYKKVLEEDLRKLQDTIAYHTGYTPQTFTYPFGFTCKECNKILKELGFKASLSCYEGVNILTKNKEDLFELKRLNRESGINTQVFFEKIN